MQNRCISASMSPTKPQDGQRIAKLLARAGVASRREIERMIADGRVAIDGKPLDTPATLVGSLNGVTVDGNPVEAPRPARLFVFHKPGGVLTTERDPAGRATIYDRLPDDLPRLVPVGRLDLNTEGLLLLTTDGGLKRQLELPSTGIERAYRARAYGDVTQAQLEDLIEGVEIDGIRYGAIDANLERRTGANVWIELILTEGKNREVRRVLEHLGLKVSRLIRTRYGPFVLGDLPVGAIGEVRQADLAGFRQMLGGKRDAAESAAITVAAPAGKRPQRRPSMSADASPAAQRAEPARPARPHAKPAAKPRPDRPRSGPKTQRQVPGKERADRVDRAPASSAEDVVPKRPVRIKRGAGWARPKPRTGPKNRGGRGR
jgi:23S rRNA pseudouridine2605 synthase